MKRFNQNLISFSMLCGFIFAFAFVGCEQKDVYNPNNGKNTPNSFDFSTTSTIELNIKYDVPEGYKVLFDVYLEYPFITDENGQEVKRTDLEPIIRRMTDGNGAYSGKETITADHGNEAYIYTSYVGVPTIFKTNFTGNTIIADINWKTADASVPQTRGANINTIEKDGYHVLGTWNNVGYPDYLDRENETKIPANVLSSINKILPEGGNCPPRYRQSIDFEINDPQNREVEIFVRYIGGGSSAASVFGYYCYKPGASTEEIKKAPRCIIFPNTLANTRDGKKGSGLKPGESVKLHYINPNGEDEGTIFPNGVKIGWFLLNNRFYDGKGAFYSTKALNTKDTRTHTARFRVNDYLILSFEDWIEDSDYNDIKFNVWSNPIEAIKDPDLPDVEPNDDEVEYSKKYQGIIAFEDNWPKKGDYDLNDVIIKYNSILNFNSKNEVLSTEDSFTTMWSGATFKNGFAYQLETERDNVTTEFIESPSTFTAQGLDKDISKATVNVFVNALDETGNNTKTSTYKIKNTFKTPVNHNVFGVAPYNPFIFVHSNLGASRNEVHLINHAPTENVNSELFHTGNDLSDPASGLYYVAAESYPFAIHLIDAENFSTTERISIDQSYPKFTNWAKSGGKEDKDWYK